MKTRAALLLILAMMPVFIQAQTVSENNENTPTSIGEQQTKEVKPEYNLSVFPNPASDFLNIVPDPYMPGYSCTLRIFDLRGKLVLEQKISGPVKIDLAPFDPGMYECELITDYVLDATKFIVI
jgi:hypothetical protein